MREQAEDVKERGAEFPRIEIRVFGRADVHLRGLRIGPRVPVFVREGGHPHLRRPGFQSGGTPPSCDTIGRCSASRRYGASPRRLGTGSHQPGAALLLLLAFFSCLLSTLPSHADAPPNLLTNPGFTAGLAGWEPLWTREPNTGTEDIDTAVTHDGKASLRVKHTGERDWSAAQSAQLPVHAGDILALSGWVKAEGNAQISLVTRSADGTVLDWEAGLVGTTGPHDWQRLARRFVVPPGVATVQYRFTGDWHGTVWLADAALVKEGSTASFGGKLHGKTLHLANATLDVTMNEEDGTLAVTDKRTGQAWHQQAPDGMIVKDAQRARPALAWAVGLGRRQRPDSQRDNRPGPGQARDDTCG